MVEAKDKEQALRGEAFKAVSTRGEG